MSMLGDNTSVCTNGAVDCGCDECVSVVWQRMDACSDVANLKRLIVYMVKYAPRKMKWRVLLESGMSVVRVPGEEPVSVLRVYSRYSEELDMPEFWQRALWDKHAWVWHMNTLFAHPKPIICRLRWVARHLRQFLLCLMRVTGGLVTTELAVEVMETAPLAGLVSRADRLYLGLHLLLGTS